MDLLYERLVTTLNKDVQTEVEEIAVFTTRQYCSYSKPSPNTYDVSQGNEVEEWEVGIGGKAGEDFSF